MRRCKCWYAYSFLLVAAVTCKLAATVDTQIASQESSCDSHEGSRNSHEGSRNSEERSRDSEERSRDSEEMSRKSEERSRKSEERSRKSDDTAVVTAADITAIPAAAAAAATVTDTTMDAIARSATRSFDKPHEGHNNNNNKASASRLNDQIVRQTNDLSKAVASLASAQKREHKMTLLEREKCDGYVNEAADKMHRLVDNLQHADAELAIATNRLRCVQKQAFRTTRMLIRSGRRLQVIRRLLAGAEVGLVHMETNRKLHIARN